MPSSRCELADDVCPVCDELLGELYRANDLFVPGFATGSAAMRGSLNPYQLLDEGVQSRL
jgi:hypothetical protein